MPLENPQNLPLLESLEALQQAEGDGPFALRLAYDEGVRQDGAKALSECPELVKVEALEIVNSLDPKALKTLLKSPHLTSLRSLSLDGSYVHDTGTKALAKWEGLQKIEHLSLDHIGLSSPGAKALIQSEYASSLVSLNLGANNLTGAFVKAFVDSPLAQTLGEVSFAGNPIKDAGVKALAAAGLPKGQRVVCFCNCELKKGGLKALLESDYLEAAEELDLSINTDLGDAGLALLIKHGLPDKLKVLNVSGTGMTDKSASEFAQSESLSGLRELWVHFISDEAMNELIESSHVGAAVKLGNEKRAALKTS